MIRTRMSTQIGLFMVYNINIIKFVIGQLPESRWDIIKNIDAKTHIMHLLAQFLLFTQRYSINIIIM